MSSNTSSTHKLG